MRFTHEAQVMPSIGIWTSAEAARTGGKVLVKASMFGILPGSI